MALVLINYDKGISKVADEMYFNGNHVIRTAKYEANFDDIKNYNFSWVIDHKPILIKPALNAINSKVFTVFDIAADQRVITNTGWYVDDFGFYIYIFGYIDFDNAPSIIDLTDPVNYDKNNISYIELLLQFD